MIAAPVRLSAVEMEAVKGAAWCCNASCASQFQICRGQSCQPYYDPTYPCVYSVKYVSTDALTCHWYLLGTCQETTNRTCKNLVAYYSRNCAPGTELGTCPVQTCWSCP